MSISIIIPCRNEGGNVELITWGIVANMPNDVQYEIIFVDDSTDDTPVRLHRLSQQEENVRYVHRAGGIGLSSAVIEGFSMAKGSWFIVMDADLQHPPGSLPDLVESMKQNSAELIIPSRFVPGGHDGGLNKRRKFVSWTARLLARLAIRRVWRIKDPTSGYFAVRRETALSKPLDPIGWKILLELIVRADYNDVLEIPYTFKARDLGASKFGIREQLQYLIQVIRLVRDSEIDFRFWKFCIVGCSGVVVNTLIYLLLIQMEMQVTLAFVIATLVAMMSNFIWNNKFTWNRMRSDQLWFRFLKFIAVSISGLCLSSAFVSSLHHWLGFHYLIAGLCGIILSTGWNFTFHNIWTFKTLKREPTLQENLSPINNDKITTDSEIRYEA